ncbi:unnamed protein product [Clonostachys solani]|uniref:Zn(2)-C6 fungal-type domain-containing protein n=1 Tax=Clonostachys solani TaxID=160281 RepID=A0A9N9VZM0_9HYPO|nr:unnamed protein product [Clonostachys solani]
MASNAAGKGVHKPKLTRAARRKKCDEEKPTCRRCRDGGWKCDGYAHLPGSTAGSAVLPGTSSSRSSSVDSSRSRAGTPARNLVVRQATPSSSSSKSIIVKRSEGSNNASISPSPSPAPAAAIASSSSSPPQTILRPTRIFANEGEALELRFLGHFFNCTLADIVHTNGPQDFWRRTLPSLAQSEPLIRHAVTALGTTHWLFMGHEFATPNQIASSEAVLNHQYNQAITRLVPLMSHPPDSNPNIPLILICCLLFVYLEALRGARTEAFQHLASGSRLLASLSEVSPTPPVSEETLREIAALFRGIGSDVTPFTYDKLLSNLASFANPAAGDSEAADKPFASLEEVWDELAEIEMQMYDTEWAAEEGGKWADVPLEHREVERASWETVKKRFLVWEARFEQTLEALGLESDESYEVLNLRLQRHMWRLMVDDDEEESWDADPTMEPDECAKVMDQVERLLSMTPSTMRVFTLHADLIPALIVVYGSCTDTAVRRRAITLLRLRRRREIVWDSEEIAQFLEADLERCLAGAKKAEWPEIGPCANRKALLFYRPPEA